MELSLGIALQICVYVLSGSAATLTLLEWYFDERGTGAVPAH